MTVFAESYDFDAVKAYITTSLSRRKRPVILGLGKPRSRSSCVMVSQVQFASEYGWVLHPHKATIGEGWHWPASTYMVSEPYFGASRKSQQSTVQPAATANVPPVGTLPLDQAPNATPDTNARKRKRTRKKAVQPSTAADIAAVESYSQIREWLFLAYESLVSERGGFPLDVDGRVSTESGQAAAPAQDTVDELDFIKFRELADISGSAKYSLPDDQEADADSNQYPILTVDGGQSPVPQLFALLGFGVYSLFCILHLPPSDLSEDVSDIFNTVVSNTSTGCKTMSLFGHSYIIPAQSSLIMSDLAKAPRLLNTLDPFDLIVMDPPWPNKSVRRTGQYGDIDVYDLFRVPLKNLLASGGYVAVWVTNKLKFHKFVREKLFPAWGVQWVGEWYWIKVTTKGEWVIDPDSVHRKPYEVLIIGRSPSSLDEHPIPEKRAICTVPSKQHSRKPFLDDVLAPYLPSNPRKLELFARNLLPKWTSWGNQVLKFNDVQYLSQK
ncbi:hypothetical protein PhCBS80983_g01380 [Powellomyces hirtus]|uniref:MT-A70-domain-containing protein n=1 Tax=Powellomyces hirtus TaxID=109895 RepID=A0A507EBJ0_9FUNG|nr:hypothetical protein PhCBS80983_g01380 [Powellomyces hirtus]